jgi:TatD DNase family protein
VTIVIDSHCHPDFPQFDADRVEMIARAAAAGVTTILAVGIGSGASEAGPSPGIALRMAELAPPPDAAWPKIYATTGIHPNEAPHATDMLLDEVARIAEDSRVLAIGEIGLDYHYETPRDTQASVFIRQMDIARAARKPIVIHSRDAWPDSLRMLREHWAPTGLGGVLHCFSGDLDIAKQGMDMGFLISFAGPLTFPKAQDLRDVARQIPRDRLLIETDSPYLAPVPHRGKRNEPAFVVEVCKRLAEVHGVASEEMAELTAANFSQLFGVER